MFIKTMFFAKCVKHRKSQHFYLLDMAIVITITFADAMNKRYQLFMEAVGVFGIGLTGYREKSQSSNKTVRHD